MNYMTRREALRIGGRLSMGLVLASSASLLLGSCSSGAGESMPMELFEDNGAKARLEALRLTVLYDNWSYAPGVATDWGFACLVEGLEKTLLFDSGRIDSTFISNLAKLRVDPQQIAAALLSHEHHDHIGGLPKLLQSRNAMQVYVPRSFSSGYKKLVKNTGAQLIEIDPPGLICSHAASTGEMHSVVKNEHSLVVRTDNGAIVLTGCAHPGILEIVHRARSMAKQEILLAMGGFHLMHHRTGSIEQVIDGFRQAGVRWVAPSHCSGEEARKLFAKAYGRRFIRSGAGRVITAADLGVQAQRDI